MQNFSDNVELFRNCSTYTEFRDAFLWCISDTTDAPPKVPYTEHGIYDVPEGTVEEVLSWVGEDPDKARTALAVELGEDEPRKTLVNDLGKIAGHAANAVQPMKRVKFNDGE